MNYAPLTVHKEMSAARTHRTFVTLGMRHLCVVNNSNRVVGIITRKDLEHAAAHGSHEHPAEHLHVSRSLVASTSRVCWRHNEEATGQHLRVSSASVRLPETLSIVDEHMNGDQNGVNGSEQAGKKDAVEHVACVSPVAESPINTNFEFTDAAAGEHATDAEPSPGEHPGL